MSFENTEKKTSPAAGPRIKPYSIPNFPKKMGIQESLSLLGRGAVVGFDASAVAGFEIGIGLGFGLILLSKPVEISSRSRKNQL